MSKQADVVIIGAGIAGSSLAFELADHLDVLLLEGEHQPGYHSTGRSAAMLIETYGTWSVQQLSRQSRLFFEQPPPGFSDTPLLSPRGYLHIARADQLDALAAAEKAARAILPSIERLDADEICALAPLVAPAYAAAGLLEANAMAIDTAALQQGYLKGFSARGGRLITNALVSEISAGAGGWEVQTTAGEVKAPILVNAAGAWADQLATQAGLRPIGLVPKRRTAILLDPPDDADAKSWPMVSDIDDEFYVKPEGASLMVSPADETPSAPTDAQPEELDVAIAVDRYETLTGQTVRTVSRRWAGLRTFMPDHSPAIGFDGDAPGFFWLAGQGGFGFMTAPAAARLAADLIVGRRLDDVFRQIVPKVAPSRR